MAFLDIPSPSALKSLPIQKTRAWIKQGHPQDVAPSQEGGHCLDLENKFGLVPLVASSGWDAGSSGLPGDEQVRNTCWGRKGEEEEESLGCQLRVTRELG